VIELCDQGGIPIAFLFAWGSSPYCYPVLICDVIEANFEMLVAADLHN
jgi:hypothetical protein